MSTNLFLHSRVRARGYALWLMLVLGPASSLFAQGLVPAQEDITRPTTSPYLNLLNNRGNPGLNYFTQVRPQQQFRAFGADLSQELQGMQGPLAGPTSLDRGGNYKLGSTGHPVGYFNYGGYYSLGQNRTQFGSGGSGRQAGQMLGGGTTGPNYSNQALNAGNFMTSYGSGSTGGFGGGNFGGGTFGGSSFGGGMGSGTFGTGGGGAQAPRR